MANTSRANGCLNDNHNQQPHPSSSTQGPYVRIVEQPARCALRFRYECEGRSAGSIPGASATPENKTYPTIQIESFKGPAVVVVSCVTKDFPYRPHPHNLVGKDGCKKGVCTMVINNADMMCSFTSLGIQCVKRKDIEESLKLRETIKVDPFRTGFAHKNQASNIDLNVVRLCFQVFIEGPEKDKFTIPLPPVVSDPIYDKKAMSDLIITKLSHCSAPVTGGKEIILLCDRVAKDDIQVRFFEEKNGQVVWEGYADFQPNDVHKQVAICFRCPKYYDETIHQPVMVSIQLRRPSDGHTSESRHFQLLPKEVDPDGLARKRQKIEEGGCIDRYLKDNSMLSHIQVPSPSSMPQPLSAMDYPSTSRSPFHAPAESLSPRLSDKVKVEAPDQQQQQQSFQQHWTDHAQAPRPSIGSTVSPSFNQNLTCIPSPTSIPHGIQQPLSQSNSQAIPQTITQNMSHSLSPSFSQSPRRSSQEMSQPQTISQQSQQQQQTLHIPQQAHSPYSVAQNDNENNLNLPDINQLNNNFAAPTDALLQGEVRQYLKNLDASPMSEGECSSAALSTAPTTLNQVAGQPGELFSQPNNSTNTNNLNNNHVENSLTEKLDSLDLDIDSNELLHDINLNNLLVMMDSGNNITFNSSGNITIDANTPHDSTRASNL